MTIREGDSIHIQGANSGVARIEVVTDLTPEVRKACPPLRKGKSSHWYVTIDGQPAFMKAYETTPLTSRAGIWLQRCAEAHRVLDSHLPGTIAHLLAAGPALSPEGGGFLSITEWLDGNDLERHFHLHSTITAEHIHRIFAFGRQMLSTAAAFMGHGILLQDVKPQNWFVQGDRLIAIDDESLLYMGPEGCATQVQRTPGFHSPERVLTRQVDAADVQFAIGATCHDLLEQVSRRCVPLPSEMNEEIKALFGSWLHPDREHRPSAQEVDARLGYILSTWGPETLRTLDAPHRAFAAPHISCDGDTDPCFENAPKAGSDTEPAWFEVDRDTERKALATASNSGLGAIQKDLTPDTEPCDEAFSERRSDTEPAWFSSDSMEADRHPEPADLQALPTRILSSSAAESGQADGEDAMPVPSPAPHGISFSIPLISNLLHRPIWDDQRRTLRLATQWKGNTAGDLQILGCFPQAEKILGQTSSGTGHLVVDMPQDPRLERVQIRWTPEGGSTSERLLSLEPPQVLRFREVGPDRTVLMLEGGEIDRMQNLAFKDDLGVLPHRMVTARGMRPRVHLLRPATGRLRIEVPRQFPNQEQDSQPCLEALLVGSPR